MSISLRDEVSSVYTSSFPFPPLVVMLKYRPFRAPRLSSKRVFLITDNDDPYPADGEETAQFRKAAITIAKVIEHAASDTGLRRTDPHCFTLSIRTLATRGTESNLFAWTGLIILSSTIVSLR